MSPRRDAHGRFARPLQPLTVGFELEVSGRAGNVLAGLRAAGLTEHEGLHAYHCGCDDCLDPRTLFKAQQDCTADGEFITCVLDYGSRNMERAIDGLGAVLIASGAGVSGNVGNHVHVSREELDGSPAAGRRLVRLFARYHRDLFEIAAGPRDGMRGYNGDTFRVTADVWVDNDEDRGYARADRYIREGHSLLCWKDSTVEFRLWNAVRSPWRIRTHVGLSHAMVQAALDGADCTEDDRRCLEQVIGDYIDGPTWAGILRQRFSKGGVEPMADHPRLPLEV